MNTETISFEVTQDLLASLKLGSAALGQHMRLLTAIAYFQDKKLSLGKAAQLAGLNRLRFMDGLAEKGVVVFDYDASACASDLDAITQLGLDSVGRQEAEGIHRVLAKVKARGRTPLPGDELP